MKRTCANCKALKDPDFTGDKMQGCSLGYEQQKGEEKWHGSWFQQTIMKPAVECPKPMTVKKYIELALEKSRMGGQMKRTMKLVIYNHYKDNMMLNRFGAINIPILRNVLSDNGFTRIPKTEKLKEMCNEVFGHEMVGGEVSFIENKKSGDTDEK